MRSLSRLSTLSAVAILTAACGSAGSAPQATSPSITPPPAATPSSSMTVAAEQATFTLIISNQSFQVASVDIDVTVDGSTVVDGPFSVDNQHHFVPYALRLAPGSHRLVARSSTGATIDETFQIPAGARRWATLFYWHADDEPKRFEWAEHDSPPAFG